MSDDEKSIEELCRPLSAKVQPKRTGNWSAGIGSKVAKRNATQTARQQTAMQLKRRLAKKAP